MRQHRRILALWFARLPTDRLLRKSQFSAPLVISHKANNALYVYALEARAQKLGLYKGQPLANARAMVQPLAILPADARADAALDQAWRRLTGGQAGAPQDLIVLGRVLRVPRAAKGVARFTFHQLCEAPLAAADYLKLAHEFHTLIIDHIPVMGEQARNEAKRFIILIDTLYDNSVKCLASAAAEPDMLYLGREGFEAQEFKRAASRLIEMRSQAYLALPHGRRDSRASALVDGIVET